MIKTIAGTTYHQDPTDSDLWYDDPANIGRQGLAYDTCETDSIRDEQDRLRSDIRDAQRGEETDEDIDTMTQRITELDHVIQILETLAK